ncbi:alpha/beta hydrolase [Paraburkholderia sp. UCT31]|uniref:alpha/beta hydrolase n=1 Tax=Paraburkholderia sp. UCT31 TaxID=2615209 RepID=UPI0016556C26|nr:alpha/beta hydrolase [Paraburkholderia sp. UCT31]MBC8740451.1 alpha/beta hydrolase [Paraburkholderia sp. UCT31]
MTNPSASLRQSLVRFGRGILLIYCVSLAGLYLAQERLLLHPSHAPSRPADNDPRFQISEWRPTGSDTVGYVLEPKAGPVRGTVLFFHGNAGDAEGRIAVGAEIVHHGYRAVLVEYPGFGMRAGPVSMASLMAASQDAFGAARRQWTGPFVLAGESLGAGVAAQVTRQQGAAVSGLLLFTPWDSLSSVAQEKLSAVPVSLLLHRDYDSAEALRSYPGPVFVVGAERDQLIPIHHAKALAATLQHPHFVALQGAEHNTWFDAVTQDQWQTMLDAAAALGDRRCPQDSTRDEH